jgi:hypothetical protein
MIPVIKDKIGEGHFAASIDFIAIIELVPLNVFAKKNDELF